MKDPSPHRVWVAQAATLSHVVPALTAALKVETRIRRAILASDRRGRRWNDEYHAHD